MHTSPGRRVLASTALLILVAATSATPAAQAAPTAAVATTVDVDVRAGLATVPETALGVNHAIWDAELGTTAVVRPAAAAGVRMLRYPGGSYSDIYHWRDHTAPGGYVAPDTDFDTFMAAAQRAGAAADDHRQLRDRHARRRPPTGSGTPMSPRATASSTGRSATRTTATATTARRGRPTTTPTRARPSTPADVVAYAQAMKAVDPTIKVGAVLTMPGNWPDGIVGAGDSGTWNQVVLSHRRPAHRLRRRPLVPGRGHRRRGRWPGPSTSTTRCTCCGSRSPGTPARNAGRIGISMTEINVGVGLNTQPGALFLADAYAACWQQGVFTVHWWNVHNGIGTVSTVAGQTDYGDFGLLSSGNCLADGSVCEPPLNTPFAPYHALTLMALLRPARRPVGRRRHRQPAGQRPRGPPAER